MPGNLRLNKSASIAQPTILDTLQTQGPNRGEGQKFENVVLQDNARGHFGDVHRIYNFHEPAQASTYEALVEHLRFDGMDARERNVTRAISGTCQWLFGNEHFAKWLDADALSEHHGFLWLQGKPGSGKSTMMKSLAQWCKRSGVAYQLVLSYFFNARASGVMEKSRLGLYRSIVHQLLKTDLDLRDTFVSMFASKVRNGKVEDWTPEELQDFIVEAVTACEMPSTTILIDALDEGDPEDIRSMVSFLQDLGHHATDTGNRILICFSSRHYPFLDTGRGVTVSMEEQRGQRQDIETYVERKLFKRASFVKSSLKLKLCTKANGVFLWVVLVVRILNELDDKGYDLPSIEQRLSSLPPKLDAFFKEILVQDPEEVVACLDILNWVSWAKTPLTVPQLWTACNKDKWGEGLPDLEVMRKRLLDIAHGLVQVVDMGQDRTITKLSYAAHRRTPAPPVVQFIHETVREFIRSSREVLLLVTPGVSVEGWGNDRCKSVCLDYIRQYEHPYLDGLNTFASLYEACKVADSVQDASGFLDYAADSMFEYAEAAQCSGMEQTAFLVMLAAARNQILKRWVRSWNQSWWTHNSEGLPSVFHKDDVSLTYILSDSGHVHLLRCLLEAEGDVSAIKPTSEQDLAKSLAIACYRNNTQVVEVLLGERLNVHTTISSISESDEDLSSHWKDLSEGMAEFTCHHDHRDCLSSMPIGCDDCNIRVVQRMLSVIFELQRLQFFSALQAGSQAGNSAVVRMLLAVNADINAEDKRYPTALQAAILHGNEKIFRVLLGAGADINVRGGKYGSALQAAAFCGEIDIFHTLLELGADVNTRGGDFGSALHVACMSRTDGHTMVKILLERGADTEAQAPLCGTPLHAAVMICVPTPMAPLCVIDSESLNGQYPSSTDEEEADTDRMVQMLKGADPAWDFNSSDQIVANHASRYTWIGDERVVRMLIDAGANVNAPGVGNFHGNVLSAAACFCPKHVIQMLLDVGANVNASGCYGNTPLTMAVRYSRKDIVQLLLDTGANVGASCSHDYTALEVAEDAGDDDITEMLVKAAKQGFKPLRPRRSR